MRGIGCYRQPPEVAGPGSPSPGAERVQKLHLVGFTTDHEGLILSARRGARTGSYSLTIDDALEEAVEERRARREDEADNDDVVTGTRRSRVESALPVREIQARLRQGRSIAEVAKAAGVDAAWVDRFAPPILAERAQVIRKVRSVPLRRARLGPSVLPIGDAVRHHLADRGVSQTPDEFTAAWTARQVSEGRWAVRFTFHHRGQDQVLRFDLDDSTGEVSTADRASSLMGYVAPRPSTPTVTSADRSRPTKAAPEERPVAKRAVVSTGFRPDPTVKAVSRSAKERERAAVAMRKAAAKRAVEGERAAARMVRERREAAARREREEQAAAARAERVAAAAQRAADAAARARKAAAKKAAAEKAKASRSKASKAAATAHRATAKKATAKKATAKKAPAKKAPARKAPAKKAPAKKAPAKKAPARKATAKKATGAQKAPPQRTNAKTSAPSVTAPRSSARPSTVQEVVRPAPGKKAAGRTPSAAATAKAVAARAVAANAVVARSVPAERAPAPEPPVRAASAVPRSVRTDGPSTDGGRLTGAAENVYGTESARAMFRRGLVEQASGDVPVTNAARTRTEPPPNGAGLAAQQSGLDRPRRRRPLRAT